MPLIEMVVRHVCQYLSGYINTVPIGLKYLKKNWGFRFWVKEKTVNDGPEFNDGLGVKTLKLNAERYVLYS